MNLLWLLSSGSGTWNPLLWLLAFIVALAAAWFIRSFGRKDFREGLQQEPFISGNEEPADGGGHIPASNLYWGFLESLSGYYSRLIPLHTGILTDYVAWFLGVMAVMLVIALIV
ncbi:MAG: hydrogenase [Kiritimatiellae bacterium]|nr:hydrogenase [Kiritimatiellia bacterium]MDD4341221.1 hydrogenase [Kiritimatiellia bacterium]